MKALTRPWTDESRPGFLDLMDQAPDQAFAQFCQYARTLVEQCPPEGFRRLAREVREDLASDTIYWCWQAGQRVLRSYRDQGRPFSKWFLVVVDRRARDEYRRQQSRKRRYVDDPEGRVLDAIRSPGPSLPEQREREELRVALRACTAQLSERCRLLLFCDREGFKPQELARQLGYDKRWCLNVSKDAHKCRRHLKDLLEAQGLH